MTIASSRKPNAKEREDFKRFMRSSNIPRLVVKIEGQDDMIIEIEQKDAEGRDLLHG